MKWDVLVVGGGAAGLMCALVAGQRGRRVCVVEHTKRVGKKILMSGGGRCNFTNLGVTPESFLSANPHFAKSALARYTPQDFIDLVDRHGIAWHEKEKGQLFCDSSSKQIVRMLLDECHAAGVHITVSCSIEKVERRADGFAVDTTHGAAECESLVVATGGLSIPRMGASGLGYQLARQFEHTIQPTRAALVPLTLDGRHLARYQDLAGISLPDAEARANGTAFQAGMLFTHGGLSGPAILQISSYWQPGDDLRLNFTPTVEPGWLSEQARERPDVSLKTVLANTLPKRLAQRLCELRFAEHPMRQYRAERLREIEQELCDWPIAANGTEGYRTAEVTLGGVDTDGLSSRTMASKHVPGLYFIGEVVDVTGWLGGYNFQWAWASGQAAGEAV
ncbi:NAD(P)/FAD-dependent oxidoreductase [Salinisphaera sp. USBA-960]|uniref:NAD(P)/FAD-dependent oxidoreductase n=1 Tax=Salinisphaera orenii TaxID=856731 RepID=UPI000DBE929C|nr:NAD(P)/FAD-dependent oxidoreductase [Salifodinibacter halophilus]NNC26619.1 NAD(P)/FAD-dependent oxidoreductase [Salifodinibacter halophilus]